jgi:hypothetical protein
MRHLTRVPFLTSLVVLMTSCGGSSVSPSRESQPAVFPVTLTRTGGIAGFQDVLVVSGDGLVSVTRKGQEPRQCRLTPVALERLTTAASQVPWSRVTPAGTHPSFPDDMVTMVQSPAGGPVRLEDPRVGAGGQVFHELLNDLHGGPAASRMCTPV